MHYFYIYLECEYSCGNEISGGISTKNIHLNKKTAYVQYVKNSKNLWLF